MVSRAPRGIAELHTINMFSQDLGRQTTGMYPNHLDDGRINTVCQISPFGSSIWKNRLGCYSLLVLPEASTIMEDKSTYGSTCGRAGGSAPTSLIPTPSILAKKGVTLHDLPCKTSGWVFQSSSSLCQEALGFWRGWWAMAFSQLKPTVFTQYCDGITIPLLVQLPATAVWRFLYTCA